MRKKLDLTGRRFGRLTVLHASTRPGGFWECRCDCDPQKVVQARADHLKSGRVVSCTCKQKENLRAPKQKKVRLSPQPAQRDRTAQDRVTRNLREYDQRHDPLLNPNPRHQALDRASQQIAQPPEQPQRPMFRRAVAGEVVTALYDRFGQANETRWVVKSPSLKLTVCHLESDPSVTRTFRNEDLSLTGLDSSGAQIKVPVRTYTPPDPNPSPGLPKPLRYVERRRVHPVTREVSYVQVPEYANEHYIRAEDGNYYTKWDYAALEFHKPRTLSDRWFVTAKKNYQAPASQRLFRPGEQDDDGAFVVPRLDVPKKKKGE
jgi:hypothetical protein